MSSTGLILITAAVLVLFLGMAFRSKTIMEFQRGLRYRKGRFVDVLEPGRYWLLASSTHIDAVDNRERIITVGGQEVMTQDGVSLKISVAGRFRVTDWNRAVNDVESFVLALHTEIQLQLRAIVGSVPVEELLQQRPEIGPRLLEACAGPASRFGLELLAAEIKDIMFPGELKRVFTQVVQARQEGLATLERARGESAALRNMANTAALIDRYPSLLHLRTLHALGATSGNTVVLALGERAAVPGVVRPSDGPEPSPPQG